MDAVWLARLQFGMTAGFHFIYPQITIGMAWLLVWMMARYARRRDEFSRKLAQFWMRVFAVSFAVGVATGLVMEFQFGTNWAAYSRVVGDVFGAPLAAEGLLAFFLESTFLGVMLFGWKKLSPKVHLLSSFFVAFGSTLSGLWIIIANSWQQTPAGATVAGAPSIAAGGRAQMTDFWEAAVNHSTLIRFLHTIDGALIAGSFLVLGMSAWFLFRRRHPMFAKASFRMALVIGLLATVVQFFLGHHSAINVYENQPIKLAAFEGHFATEKNASLLVFGIPDPRREKTHLAVKLPGMLSFGLTGDFEAEVKGLSHYKDLPGFEELGPRGAWPPILLTFFTFHLMVALWVVMMLVTFGGLWQTWRGKLDGDSRFSRWYLRLAMFAAPAPIIANTLGWISAEVGRQPWVVYPTFKNGELADASLAMLTRNAVSRAVSAQEILVSLIVFGTLYALLFLAWLFLIRRFLRQGPDLPEPTAEQEVQS